MCFFFQAEDGIRDIGVTGVQTCALPIFYIAGGVSSVGNSITNNLNIIERFSGSDRYETSAKIAAKTMSESDKAFLASGEVFADALVVGSIAATKDAPIVLTKKNQLPNSVKRSEERRVGKECRS